MDKIERIVFRRPFDNYIIDHEEKKKTFRIIYAATNPGSDRDNLAPVIGQEFILAENEDDAKDILLKRLDPLEYYIASCTEETIPWLWAYKMAARWRWRRLNKQRQREKEAKEIEAKLEQ